MTSEQKSRLRTLWLAGVKMDAIVAELGVAYETIKKNRRRLGLPPRTNGGSQGKPIPLPTLIARKVFVANALWRQGIDTTSIARRLNVIEAAVYNSLSNYREQIRKGKAV